MQRPFELAELLLDDAHWTRARMEEVVASKQTTRINLLDPVEVIVMYWTVDPTGDGGLVFKPDVYDRDPAVLAGLNQPFSFRDAPILEDQARR